MADTKRLNELLDQAIFFQFLTVDGDKPKGRQFSFHMLYNGKLVFCTEEHKNVYKQMLNNPYAEIIAVVAGGFLRYSGKVEFIDDPEAEKQAKLLSPMLNQIFGEDSGLSLKFFCLTDDYAEIRTMKGELREVI